MNAEVKIDRANLKPLPVGNSAWAEFSQNCYTVDKTLFIKEILDDETTVALFTRPRRFGKTTAMKMLKAFFEKTPKDTSFLFRDLKIWAAGERYRSEQGRYPVIYLTLKDVDGKMFESAFEAIRMVVARMVGDHCDAIPFCGNPEDEARLDRVWHERGSAKETGAALGLLAKAVHLHAQKSLAEGEDPRHAKPVILIDEYDTPVNKASSNGYLGEMTAFMKDFLSGALKDNEHVRMGLMTGVLRVAKEGILSGLNNLRVWTVFDAKYGDSFGFTQDEVLEMASFYGAADRMPEIKSWYDGYDFGGREIYNPWSVLNYFDRLCKPDAYWLDTSSNDVIMEIVRDLPHDTAETLEQLLGEDARAHVRMAKDLGPFAQIRERKDTLYALLVSAGYLKCCSPVRNGFCDVAIPNREIAQVFVEDIVSKLSNAMPVGPDDIATALDRGNPIGFRDAIRKFLTESVSFFDGAAEGFYHGLVLGCLAILRDRYRVLSNRESGDGRFDIALFPLVRDFPGVIVEVKAAKSETDDLKKLAQDARDQIDAKNYVAEMAAQGVTDVMKLGLAFYRKNVELQDATSPMGEGSET